LAGVVGISASVATSALDWGSLGICSTFHNPNAAAPIISTSITMMTMLA
jgi:hypothetical protein